ncbi:MAG TPA: ATP-dependent DNA helicase UvrD2 [Candidatus Nanopelagicaceae bacterium]|nr:ATP-dependent DNA helicase UvrD2 [Candidatus Nanopelagicaceae bacterium]
MSADQILASLDDEQRQVAINQSGPLCVLAGAGTGKTRAITHRIAYGVQAGMVTPQNILALTFTSRAAGEMRTRLRTLGVSGVQARTFHAAALRQLTFFWPKAVGSQMPEIIQNKSSLIAKALTRSDATDRALLRDLASEIEWAKVSQIAHDDYLGAATEAGRATIGNFDLAQFASIYADYDEIKSDSGHIDFEDVLLLTVGILNERDDIAGQIRAQYSKFIVDEYQDVSPLQQRLLDLWLGERRELCVVGDASQTIYTFAGATPAFLLGFTTRYPDAQTVRLVRDYRSTPEVVDLANRLLKNAPGKVDLISIAPSGPRPTFSDYSDEVVEASEVARSVAKLVDSGVSLSEIAILYRTNSQSAAYEESLTEQNIPYQVRGGERFFERTEVKGALRLLRGAAVGSPESDVRTEVVNVLESTGWSLLKPPPGGGAVRSRWESLAAIVALYDELAATRSGLTLRQFVDELDERRQAQHAPTLDGVTLATLHSAKGLEWDAVFVVGLSEGLMPISMATTEEGISEERRLLYVGITRARTHLFFTWSHARTPGARATRSASRFLDLLRPSVARARSVPKPPRALAKCRICQRPLATSSERKLGRCATCPGGGDIGLLDQLREWRTLTAKATNMPAYTVFTDSTLQAIAEIHPTTLEELAGISGVGPIKLTRYGEELLALLS